jgi:hypothetical protein
MKDFPVNRSGRRRQPQGGLGQWMFWTQANIAVLVLLFVMAESIPPGDRRGLSSLRLRKRPHRA